MWVFVSTLSMPKGFVVFNEAHSTHVGGQLERLHRCLGGLKAAVAQLQIEDTAFGGGIALVPLAEGLDVDCAD